ncbi:hypothetical protein EsH8_III_000051 [Colletotrichum jinshuiense]
MLRYRPQRCREQSDVRTIRRLREAIGAVGNDPGLPKAKSPEDRFRLFNVATVEIRNRTRSVGSETPSARINPPSHHQLRCALHSIRLPSSISRPSRRLVCSAAHPAPESACPEFVQIAAARTVEQANMNRDPAPV